ncbi:hypothetical protein AHAS_Ahas05G0262800 [Arachis hypogaea]
MTNRKRKEKAKTTCLSLIWCVLEALRTEVVWEDTNERSTVAGSKKIIPLGDWYKFQPFIRRRGHIQASTSEAGTSSTAPPPAASQPTHSIVFKLFQKIDQMEHRNK